MTCNWLVICRQTDRKMVEGRGKKRVHASELVLKMFLQRLNAKKEHAS